MVHDEISFRIEPREDVSESNCPLVQSKIPVRVRLAADRISKLLLPLSTDSSRPNA